MGEESWNRASTMDLRLCSERRMPRGPYRDCFQMRSYLGMSCLSSLVAFAQKFCSSVACRIPLFKVKNTGVVMGKAQALGLVSGLALRPCGSGRWAAQSAFAGGSGDFADLMGACWVEESLWKELVEQRGGRLWVATAC